MNILPNELIMLDDNLQRAGAFSRLDPLGSIGGRVLAERDYDELIVEHLGSVADALRQAGVIEKTSDLIYLGRVLSIDVLLAEVEQETRTFNRLVVVEDKLFRNPEARRAVLGQILDYAKVLRETDFSRLCDLLSEEHRSWLDGNDDLIAHSLRHADFLLLICGDRIQPRVVEYVKHLKEQLDPLVAVDVALMSIAIFSDGTHHILVPYVVGLITAERGITIKVVLQGPSGEVLPATIGVDEENFEKKRGRDRIEIDALLDSIRSRGGDAAASVAQRLFNYATELGAEVIPMGASASVRVRDLKTGRRSTLFVVTRKAGFVLGWLDRWTLNSGVSPEVADAYQRRLTEILGTSPLGRGVGSPGVPLTEVGEHIDSVLDQIQFAVKALRHSETL